jgi:hypothetical protein
MLHPETRGMGFDKSYRPKMVLACRRTGLRHRLWRAHDACVEFTLQDGRPRRLDLLEIGSGGVCFGWDESQSILEPGATIEGAVLRVAETSVAGTLVIAHATEEFAAGTICGAQFRPAREADERAYSRLIAAFGG